MVTTPARRAFCWGNKWMVRGRQRSLPGRNVGTSTRTNSVTSINGGRDWGGNALSNFQAFR